MRAKTETGGAPFKPDFGFWQAARDRRRTVPCSFLTIRPGCVWGLGGRESWSVYTTRANDSDSGAGQPFLCIAIRDAKNVWFYLPELRLCN